MSEPRVRVEYRPHYALDPAYPWIRCCGACGDLIGSWRTQQGAIESATCHAATCPALILARLRGELEGAVREWREIADIPSTNDYDHSQDYGRYACADDLDAILARLP